MLIKGLAITGGKVYRLVLFSALHNQIRNILVLDNTFFFTKVNFKGVHKNLFHLYIGLDDARILKLKGKKEFQEFAEI